MLITHLRKNRTSRLLGLLNLEMKTMIKIMHQMFLNYSENVMVTNEVAQQYLSV